MRKSKAGLFLMELLISLLFFAFAGAICLQLFVGAHNQNTSSTRLGMVSVLLTSYAESFYNLDSYDDIDGTLYYNEHLNKCSDIIAVYSVDASITSDDYYDYMHVIIKESETEEVLQEYDFKKYIRRTIDATQE